MILWFLHVEMNSMGFFCVSGSRYSSGGAVGPCSPTGQLQPGKFHLSSHTPQHWQNRLCIQRGQDLFISTNFLCSEKNVSPIFSSVCHWLKLCIFYFVSFSLPDFNTLSDIYHSIWMNEVFYYYALHTTSPPWKNLSAAYAFINYK